MSDASCILGVLHSNIITDAFCISALSRIDGLVFRIESSFDIVDLLDKLSFFSSATKPGSFDSFFEGGTGIMTGSEFEGDNSDRFELPTSVLIVDGRKIEVNI